MNIEVRPLIESDYEETLLQWWEQWGWNPPPKDFLPKSGIAVLLDNKPVCAGYLYTTNSKVAWVEWVISDPNFRVEPDRHECLNLLVASLTQAAAGLGHKYIYALLKNDSLTDVYKKFGYIQGDSYNKEMIKTL